MTRIKISGWTAVRDEIIQRQLVKKLEVETILSQLDRYLSLQT